MPTLTLSQLSDAALTRDLAAMVVRERHATATVLAHLAEFDARRLYLPAGYPSMYAYCMGELRYSEDAAYKRIQAARTARQFPAVLAAVAGGRLHLTAVIKLRPYLAAANANDLVAAAAHKSKAEVEQLLAERFPRSELLAWVQPISPPSGPPAADHPASSPMTPDAGLAPRTQDACVSSPASGSRDLEPHTTPESAAAAQLVPEPVRVVSKRSIVTPIAPTRYALQATIGQATQDKLRHATELLAREIPSGDVAEVLDRALDALIVQLEKRKCAATARPRRSARRASSAPSGGGAGARGDSRRIPAQVKRAVWSRDQGRCTFVGVGGRRCGARRYLELDHVDPVARGGRSSVDNVRLRCRGHNQLEAERVFGADFMRAKRAAARGAGREK